jgi:HK97 family phage prohead protease
MTDPIRFREVRSLFLETPDLELRVEGTAEAPKIVGYAAVWDEETELYPGYREVVRKGSFEASIPRDDVLGLFEHREDRLLARSSAGTLELIEDDHGLRYAMTPRDASWIREDVLEPIRRRELRGSSFGFFIVRDEVIRDEDRRGELREILEAKLIDVSPVARPAYSGTEVALRSRAGDLPGLLLALRRQGLDDPQMRAAFEAGLAALPAPAEPPREPEPPKPEGPGADYYEAMRAKIPPAPPG